MNRPDADTLFSFSIGQNTISPEDLQAESRIQYSEGIDLSPGGSVPYHVIIDRGFKIRHSQENFEKGLLVGIIQDIVLERLV
jgi:hypothetical protein